MTQLTLTYFDIHGGRAEAARLALHLGGIVFEDKRLVSLSSPKYAKPRL